LIPHETHLLSKNNFPILWLLILFGLAAGLISFTHRYGAEARNRRVELVIDYADAQLLANTTPQRAMDETLRQLRQAGITTVAVTEDTLGTLLSNGVLLPPRRDGNTTILTFAPGFPGQLPRVLKNLQEKTRLAVTQEGQNTLRVNAPWPQFNSTPIGLDDEAVKAVQRNHLLVAPRLLNFTGVTRDNIAWELAQTKAQCETAQGIGPLIFSGAAVLGNRALIPVTADEMARDGLTYGSVEFAKTFGDDDLSRRAAAQTVRVHSIGNDEMGAMDEPTAIERFVRAARERNIRVCYVRLFTNGLRDNGDVIQANTAFVGKIRDGLEEARVAFAPPLTLGQAHPYDKDPKPGLALRVLMAWGVMAGLALLGRVFTGLDGKAFGGALLIALLLGAALAIPGTGAKGREILALIAACVFPTLGLCCFTLPAASPNVSLPLKTILGRAFGGYARMSLATLAGIVLVVGLLSGRLFLIKVDEFFGVKLVLVTPVVLVAAYYALGLATLGSNAGWGARRDRVLETVRSVASQPLLVGQIVIGLVALVALALFVARSGNDPGVGVSATELKTRALLDKYLFVRPRTKEFLLGHPALFFALAAACGGRFPRAILPLLVIGAVGQSSLMDTFCHLHTPLFISLLRGLIGWVLGALIGAAVFALALRVSPPAPSSGAAREEWPPSPVLSGPVRNASE